MTLAATLDRLARIDPWFGGDVGTRSGDGWFLFDEVTVDDIRPRVDALAAEHGGHRDVAGSYLGGWFAGAAVIVPVACLVLEQRLPDPQARLWVRAHPEGWFDRVAYDEGTGLIAGDDAGLDAFASSLVHRLTPVLDHIRSLAPFGRRGLWGGLADEVASAALWAAREGGADQRAAWATAGTLIDELAARVPWLAKRPSPFTVDGALWSVKGSCCLYYKTQPQPPDPSGESYCTSCPFRDDRSRCERLVKLT